MVIQAIQDLLDQQRAGLCNQPDPDSSCSFITYVSYKVGELSSVSSSIWWRLFLNAGVWRQR